MLGIPTLNIVEKEVTKVAVVKDNTIHAKTKLSYMTLIFYPSSTAPDIPHNHNILADTAIILDTGALAVTDNDKYTDETAGAPREHVMTIAEKNTATARAAGDPER